MSYVKASRTCNSENPLILINEIRGENGQSTGMNPGSREQSHNGPQKIPEVLAAPSMKENSWNM